MTIPTVSVLPSATDSARHDSAAGDFWCSAIEDGSTAVLRLTPEIDALAASLLALPHDGGEPGAVIDTYQGMINTRVRAWQARSRGALLDALNDLHQFSASLCARASADLSIALAAAASGKLPGRRNAARLIEILTGQLAVLAPAFEAVNQQLGSDLVQMASASSGLETDTVLVTQRLHADQVHTLILEQQLDLHETRLEQAQARQRSYWLLGPRADMIRNQITTEKGELDGLRRQLLHIRGSQARTMAEAAHLQSLLPTLSAYLDGIVRIGAAIDGLCSGINRLQLDLAALRRTRLAEPGGAALARADLEAALPRWLALADAGAIQVSA